MITPEEREEIILEAIERALLMLPDVVGNLMTQQVANAGLTKDFYDKYPDFKKNKDAVVSVLEKLDGENPTMDYKKLLDKAVPEIKRRMGTVEQLDMIDVARPKIDFNHGEI